MSFDSNADIIAGVSLGGITLLDPIAIHWEYINEHFFHRYGDNLPYHMDNPISPTRGPRRSHTLTLIASPFLTKTISKRRPASPVARRRNILPKAVPLSSCMPNTEGHDE